MSPQPAKQIGGEYGDIRANIDVENLSAYLLQNVDWLRGPFDVKQFKVCNQLQAWILTDLLLSLARCVSWAIFTLPEM